MTQQEYEQKKRECWEEFWKFFQDKGNAPTLDIQTIMFNTFMFAFDRAYALGKQEKDADTVISGWVARDEDADCPRLYNSKPYRKKKGFEDGYWVYGLEIGLGLDPNLFPNLTWDDDPIEVEITIKRKKK